MKDALSRLVVACGLACLVGACATTEVRDLPAQYLTGRVLDQQTMQPIEGAYVMASYAVRVAGPVPNATRCVKTLGMHTAADGEFRFPLERLDGLSPSSISAIKFGYRRGEVKGRDLHLVRQDRSKPVFLYGVGGEAFCIEAATTAEAAAGRRFLELQRDEMAEYRADEAQVRGLETMIRLLKGIDERPPIMAR